jgi:hypothetical protein
MNILRLHLPRSVVRVSPMRTPGRKREEKFFSENPV